MNFSLLPYGKAEWLALVAKVGAPKVPDLGPFIAPAN